MQSDFEYTFRSLMEADEDEQQEKKQAEASSEGDAESSDKTEKLKQSYLKIIQYLEGQKSYDQYLQALRKIVQDDNNRKIVLWGIQNGVDGNGQKATMGRVNVSELFPTQNEIGVNDSLSYPLEKDPSGIPKLFKNPVKIGENPIVVYYDGKFKYILDGHHRWSQVYMFNPQAEMDAVILKDGFARSPIGALKNLQLIIGSASNNQLPSSSKSGINIYTNDVRGWIEERVNKDTGRRALEIFNKATGNDFDESQFVDYLVGNIQQLVKRTGAIAKKMPSRSDMPQTDKYTKGGTLGVAQQADNVVTETKRRRGGKSGELLNEKQSSEYWDKYAEFVKKIQSAKTVDDLNRVEAEIAAYGVDDSDWISLQYTIRDQAMSFIESLRGSEDRLNRLDRSLGESSAKLNESTEEFNIYKKLVGDDLAREIVAFWDISDPYRDGDLDWQSDYFQDMTIEDLIYNIEMDVENAEDILAHDEDLKLLGGPEFEDRLGKEVRVGKRLIAKLKSLTESKKLRRRNKVNEAAEKDRDLDMGIKDETETIELYDRFASDDDLFDARERELIRGIRDDEKDHRRILRDIKAGKKNIHAEESLKLKRKVNEAVDEKVTELRQEIYDVLDGKDGIPYEYVSVRREGDEILADVSIHWGDWKHDHLYCDELMSNLGFDYDGEDVTDEDGSDCFSAIRHYRYEDNWRKLLSLAKENEWQKKFR